HLAGGVVDHRGAGGAAAGVAGGGVADGVLPGPVALLQPVDEAVDGAAVDPLPVAGDHADGGAGGRPGAAEGERVDPVRALDLRVRRVQAVDRRVRVGHGRVDQPVGAQRGDLGAG